MHKEFSVKSNGNVARIERVEVTENKEKLTIDQIESMVDGVVSKRQEAQNMLDQADERAEELRGLLQDAISNTKNKDVKKRFQECKKKL